MRLLKPSPGEAADRQTILWLKIQYGSGGAEPTKRIDINPEKQNARVIVENSSPINVQPFVDENESIQRYLENSWFPDLPKSKADRFNTLLEELAEINHEVWKLTDQAHILKDAPDRAQEQANKRAAEVLYLTIELNDKRAKLVRDINELFEIRHVEKIFA